MRLTQLMIALAAAIPAAAQYVPFPTDSAEWLVQRTAAGPGGQSSISFSRYVLSGDTTLNDTVYHKLYETYDFAPGSSTLVAGIREETQRVYARRIGFNGLLAGCQWDPDHEVMLYDYTLDAPGDSLVIHHPWIGDVVFQVFSIDSVMVDGAPRRRINCMNMTYSCGPMPLSYIEGVGSERHVLDPFMLQTYEVNYLLACFKLAGDFHYSAFPTPPLCDITTVGLGDAVVTASPLHAHQRSEVLVVNAPGAHRVRLIDSWGRIVHEHAVTDGAALMPIAWSTGVYHVQALDDRGAIGGVVPVVLLNE